MPSSSCSPPVKSFLSGWVAELRAKGYQAGVYANPSPISSDVSTVSPLPDDIWVAKGDNRVTTLGLSFSDSLWPKNQRIHQYFQDRKQAFGGTASYQIDADIDDAPIAAGLGDKLYSGFTFSDVIYPGPVPTAAIGINDLNSAGAFINSGETGQIVGMYEPPPFSNNFGFMDNSGTYTQISGSLTNPTPSGINNKGLVVGYYLFGSGSSSTFHGYVQNGTGTPVDIAYPGSASTSAYKINDDGQIVGSYDDSAGKEHAFLYNYGGNKTFQTDDGPGATSTGAIGINGSGQVVGGFADSTGAQHGFIWNAGTDGSDVTIPIIPRSINNNGQVTDFNVIYEEATGSLQTVPADPNCSCGQAGAGINDSAQITGLYAGPKYARGLVAAPQ